MTGIAAFDLDGTLTTRDTVVPFLVSVCGPRAVAAALAADARRYAAIAAGRGDRDQAKTALVRRLLTGRDADALREAGETYAARVFATRMRHDVVARLLWHQRRGHEVVIVSAAFDVYVGPLADRLGADALATRLEVGTDGRCTGRLDGANVRGPEKCRRLADWRGERAGRLWAYGNSRDDAPMLAIADEATLVGRAPVPREFAVTGVVTP